MSERQFKETTETQRQVPLLLGFLGPPGGGKTKSALRVADGMARVFGGKPALIDTENGRSLKYKAGPRNPDGHDFHHINFSAPFIPADFLEAIRQAERLKPSCIIVDSMSDEHEGEGGVLDWHDKNVPSMGGNEWAAWNKPKASRRLLISGIQQILTPLIFTFRAREKTKTETQTKNGRTREVPVNIGFMPIAPAEIVHTLDMTCLLPPRANGQPVWSSEKAGEDFTIKLPEFLAPFIVRGAPLSEDLGEALAHWARGDEIAARPTGDTVRKRTPAELVDDYVARLETLTDAAALMAFQQDAKTAAFTERLKTTRADLYDRVVTANSRRAVALRQDTSDEEWPQLPGQTGDNERQE